MELSIRHRNGAYPIIPGDRSLLARPDLADAVWLTDSHLATLYPEIPNPIVVAPGEVSKSIQTYESVLRQLAKRGMQRRGTLVAFGGGVIGDLGGFVAASYMRGVRLVQIPSSLLAMVDSSVGGKVGIDLPEGKNLVGAFYPPEEVLLIPELLSTLPKREFTNGVAEIAKYGFIMDRALAARMAEGPLTETSPDLSAIVLLCIMHKAHVVQNDEFETNGLRATLNFGHTIGHAIERQMGYTGILHGEAISVGIVLEARLGERLGVTQTGTTEWVRNTLALQGLPTQLPEGLAKPELVTAMRLDKKSSGAGLAFALLVSVGECTLTVGVDPDAVENVLNEYS